MTIFDATRDRAYPDTFVENLIQNLTVPDCTGTVFDYPGWDDTAYVVLPLTGREIERLLSCVEYGADLLYPDAVHQIYWSFVQGLECSVLCDAIVNQCLTDAGFRGALLTALAGEGALSGSGGSSKPSPLQTGLILADLGEGCDDEDRFGVAYKMVELLDVVSTDILDVLQLLADNVEIAIELASRIPLVGAIIGVGLDIAAYMVDIAIDGYAAAFDTATHDALACAIFCEMTPSCQLTLQNVMDAYRSILTIELDIPDDATNFSGIAEFLRDIGSIFADEVLAASMHWLVLQTFARGSAFNASTERIMQIALTGAVPVPLPSGGCPCNWYHDWINEDNNGSEWFTFYPVGTSGTPSYNSGSTRIEGVYHPTSVPTASNYIFVTFDGASLPFTLRRMRFELAVSNQRSATDGFYLADSVEPVYPPDSTEIYSDDLDNGQTVVDTGSLNGGAGVTVSDGLALYAFVAQTDDAQTFYITRIEIWGSGTDPFAE